MNVATAFASFTYKVKALFRVNKKQTARVYEHVPKFERQNSKSAQKSPTKHSPRRSPSTSRKRNEPARPNEQRNYLSFFTNIKDSLVKLVSGADNEQEELTKSTRAKTESTGTSHTATKVNKQTSYDVEATAGEDEIDFKEDTKLLQEDEDDDDEEVFTEESKGTTSSLQAGWNISNLIQGKNKGQKGDHILLIHCRIHSVNVL